MTKIKTSSTNFVNKSLLSACPVTHVLNLIGGRWKALIVWNLIGGTMRFSELRDQIEMISENFSKFKLFARCVKSNISRN